MGKVELSRFARDKAIGNSMHMEFDLCATWKKRWKLSALVRTRIEEGASGARHETAQTKANARYPIVTTSALAISNFVIMRAQSSESLSARLHPLPNA